VNSYHLDITDTRRIDELFSNEKYDILINLLHDTSKNFNLSEDFSKNIEIVYKNIFKIIELTNPNRILFSSSGAVYGESSLNNKGFFEDEIDTNHFKGELKDYSSSKKFFESKVISWQKQSKDRSYFIFRIFSVYGSDSKSETKHAITEFIKLRRAEKNIIINSPLTKRSYLHINDIARWINKFLCKDENLILNFSSDNTFSMEGLANIISNIKCEFKTTKVLINNEKSNPTFYFGNNLKRKKMGLIENENFQASLKKQIDLDI
jgi:nucleoside-diphosphate-sugar epimerase